MGFKTWIHRYYGMLVDEFLKSPKIKEITFSDLANAYNAGRMHKDHIVGKVYALVNDHGLEVTDELEPIHINRAHDGKMVIIDLIDRSCYLPGEGWVSLMEGECDEKEQEERNSTKIKVKKKDGNSKVN